MLGRSEGWPPGGLRPARAVRILVIGGMPVLLVLLTSACAALAIPEGIPGVPVPPAATPAAFADVDLVALLNQAGNLPGGLTGSQIQAPPAEWAVLGVPDPITATMQIFEQRGAPKGSVILSLYGSDAALKQAAGTLAYTIQEKGEVFAEGKQLPTEVGEQAILVPADSEDSPTDLLFVRCGALAYIHLETGKTDIAAVTAYATKLDTLLRSAVCR